MGTKYSTTTVASYNSSPPADDGSTAEANKVKWATIKTKLNDPVKTALESINTKLVEALDTSAVSKTANYTTVAGDHNKTVEIASTATSGITVELGDAAAMAAGYTVTISNQSGYSQTVGRDTGGDTINEAAGNFTLPPKHAATFQVNAGLDGYNVLSCSATNIGAWISATPTPTAGSGTLTSASCALRYTRTGNIVHVSGRVSIVTNGTAATYVSVPAPVADRASVTHLGVIRALAGGMGVAYMDGNSRINLYGFDGSYPGSDGAELDFSVVYEAA
jgi:hypothetical protein